MSVGYGGVSVVSQYGTKSLAILSPAGGENIAMFYTPVSLTLKEVRAVLRGTTPTMPFSVYSGDDRGNFTSTLVNNFTADSISQGSVATLASTEILTGRWVWIVLGTPTGTVTEFHITVTYL